MSLQKKKDEARIYFNGKYLTAREYLAEMRRLNNKRINDAKTEDPFKAHFRYDQAMIKQHEHEIEIQKKMQLQDQPNRKITEFLKKEEDK